MHVYCLVDDQEPKWIKINDGPCLANCSDDGGRTSKGECVDHCGQGGWCCFKDVIGDKCLKVASNASPNDWHCVKLKQ